MSLDRIVLMKNHNVSMKFWYCFQHEATPRRSRLNSGGARRRLSEDGDSGRCCDRDHTGMSHKQFEVKVRTKVTPDVILILFKFLKKLSFGTRTDNLLIFGQTPEPSCLEARRRG